MRPLSGSLPGELRTFLEAVPSDLKSHPGKSLRQHLRGVWALSKALQEHLSLPVNSASLRLAALTHDTGKAHPRFQAYLAGDAQGIPHAAPSAWWTLALGLNCDLPFHEVIWAAEAVRRHHTGLMDFENGMLLAWNSDDAAANRPEAWAAARNLLPEFPTRFGTEGLPALEDLFWDLDVNPGMDTWLSVRLLYSTLIASDRMHASGIRKLSFPKVPPLKLPHFDKPHSQVNRWRQSVQEACFDRAGQTMKHPGVYSLTLPTGAGKTLTGMRIASDLIQRKNLRSLIYVLPFISIVKQTADTARQSFPPDLIQEDHSLVPLRAEEGYHPWQHMTALFRYWHQPLIITTLAQFWEALFAPRANRTMNFHRLARSVIILDEPQTLPPKYWDALGRILEMLARELGSYLILMTATQPQIAASAGKNREIAPKTYRFPRVRHRYQVCHPDASVSLDALGDLLLDEGLLSGSPSGMLVMNTKASALQVYDLVQSQLAGRDDVPLLLLSAWLTPWHRDKVLKKLITLEKDHSPRILTATQVVEAGVDLDFTWVVRDLGPLDSIIQVAGRCNRHNQLDQPGRVFTTWLEHENGHPFSSYVYDSVLLAATRDVLSQHHHFDESRVPDMIQAYYRTILNRLTPEDIAGSLARGEWATPPVLYEALPLSYVPLIIEETDQVAGLVRTLENTRWSLGNLVKKKELMRRLQQHVIEIPLKVQENLALHCGRLPHDEPLLRPVLGGEMLFLSKKMIGSGEDHIYDPVRGLVPPKNPQDKTFIW
jgi:CRISPR-associated endonuclease/helicase Cas3